MPFSLSGQVRRPGGEVLPRWVAPGGMTDRMTIVPLFGPVRLMATLGGRQSASRLSARQRGPEGC
jgi:hypothetical protein